MSHDLVAYGIYPDRSSFEAALGALRAANFRNSDISAILPERDRTTRDLAHEINTKAPEGAATGAGAGAAIGGVLGWLVGIGASPSRALARSSRPVRLSPPLRAREQPARRVDSWAAWSGWAFLRSKRNAMQVGFARVRTSFPCIATIATGRNARRKFSRRPAATTW